MSEPFRCSHGHLVEWAWTPCESCGEHEPDLAEACRRLGITMRALPGGAREKNPPAWSGGAPAKNWRVRLLRPFDDGTHRALSLDFYGGSAVDSIQVADVVFSVLRDVLAARDREFFSELAYGLEPGQVLDLFESLKKSADLADGFFSADEMDELLNLEW